MEDQDFLLEAKLDHSNILLIARVLKIKPYEPFLIISPFKPSVQFAKKLRNNGAVVRVDDIKLFFAMYGCFPDESDWIHGVEIGKKERKKERGRRKKERNDSGYYSSSIFDRRGAREANRSTI